MKKLCKKISYDNILNVRRLEGAASNYLEHTKKSAFNKALFFPIRSPKYINRIQKSQYVKAVKKYNRVPNDRNNKFITKINKLR